MPVITTVSTAV